MVRPRLPSAAGPAPRPPQPDRRDQPQHVAAVLQLQRMAGNAAVTQLLARQPATAPAPSPRRTWEDWFYYAANDPKRALALAPSMVESMTFEEAIEHGTRFVAWLERNGKGELAERALRTIEMAWWTRHAADPSTGAAHDLPAPKDLVWLISSGTDMARTGKHSEAIGLLTRAYLLAQMQAEQDSVARQEEIDTADSEYHVGLRRPVAYARMSGHYDRMREILGVYPRLVRELRAAGKKDEATAAAGAGARLRKALQEHFTLTDPEWEEGMTGRAMITEFTQVQTKLGPGLRIHGANWDETDVTQLPGLPNPSELTGRLQHSSLADIGAALAGQVDLTEELLGRPEVAKLFPNDDLDMSRRDHRLKVWRAMLDALRRDLGEAAALTALLELMERYQKAFTVHTDFNVRDFGTSYLDSAMPDDLLKRTERDCGVYALNAAYELFLTARRGGPTLDFSLVSVPGHVMLAITVRGKDAVYVVNNEQIDGPHKGSVEDIAARFIAPVFQHRFLATPAMVMPLGSTDMKEAAFKKSAWESFRDSSSWGLNVPTGPPGESSDDVRRRTEGVYRDFYEGMAAFDRLCGRLEQGLAAASGTDKRDELGSRLAALEPTYLRAADLFDLLLNTRWAGDEKSRPGVEQRLMKANASKILIATPTADPPHPLVRAVMAILRFQALGGRLNTAQQTLVGYFSKLDPFDKQIARYVAAGTPARF